MAFARDTNFARNYQQSEVASFAFEAAERPLTDSIMNNPDALLAYRLQRMEIESPPLVGSHLTNDIHDDSTRIALQIQEQELLEQELHDAELANRLAEEGHIENPRRHRVSHLGAAIQDIGNNRHRMRNRLDFTQSFRGPSSTVGSMVTEPGIGISDDNNPRLSSISDTEDVIESDGPVPLSPPGRFPPILENLRLVSRGPSLVQDDDLDTDDALHVLPGNIRRPRSPVQFNLPPVPALQQRRPYHQRHPRRNQERRPGLIQQLRRNLGHHGDIYQAQNIENDIDLNDYEALWELEERNGEVKRKGLTSDQISRIPFHKYKFQPGLNRTYKSDKNSCSICLSEYSNGEKITTLPCLHSFHKPCIDKWLKKQAVCPVCRQNVKPD